MNLSRRRQRAMTIIEQLVTMTLMLLFTTLVYTTFNDMVRNVRRVESQTDLQRETLQAIAWFNREASDSNAEGFWDYTATEEGVVFVSPRDASMNVRFDAAGRLQWCSYIGFYREDRGVPPIGMLIRRQCPIPFDWNLPNRITVATLKAMPGVERVVGRNVEKLEGDPELENGDVNDVNPIDLKQPQQFTIKTKLTDITKRSYGLKVSTSVFFRN